MTEPQHKRKGISELGPGWISAIASLITALAVAGFFAGRASSPTNTGSGGSTLTPPASAGKTSQANTQRGTPVAHYSLDLSQYYGISINTSRPQPQNAGPCGSPVDLEYGADGCGFTSQNQLAPIDKANPTFQDCVNDTRYTQQISDVGPGTAMCYSGNGFIAAIVVTAEQNNPTPYASLKVTVWQRP